MRPALLCRLVVPQHGRNCGTATTPTFGLSRISPVGRIFPSVLFGSSVVNSPRPLLSAFFAFYVVDLHLLLFRVFRLPWFNSPALCSTATHALTLSSSSASREPFLHFFCAILHLFQPFIVYAPLQINDLRKKLHHRHFGVRRRVAAVRSSRGRFCGLSRISWFQLLFPGSELASHLEHPPRRDARRGRRAACPTTALLRI